jgi:hypothetical protein
MFSFLCHRQDFYRTWLYMSNTAGILYEAGTAYLSRAHELILVFLVESVLLISLVFWVAFAFWVPLWCPLRFSHNNVFTSRFFCRRTHVLFTLFMFLSVKWCPTHIFLCCLFVLFFFVLLTLCCQFLWIVLYCPFGIL